MKDRGTRGGAGIPYVPDATPEASIDPLLTDYIRRELEKIQDYTQDIGDRLAAAEWSVGRRNILINGGFDIWQRGTSFTSNATAGYQYTADRWRVNWSGASGTALRNTASPGNKQTLGNGFYLNVTTSSDYTGILQVREGGIRYQGKRLTASGYIRQSGNRTLYSQCTLYNRTNLENAADSNIVNITELLPSLERYHQISWSLTPPTIPSNWAHTDDITLAFTLCSTYGDNSTDPWSFGIFNAQLEEADRATPFEILPVAETLALCQRYYIAIYGELGLFPQEASATNTLRRLILPFPTTMKSTPACSVSNVVNGSITSISPYKDLVRLYGPASAANQYLYCLNLIADAEI